MTEAVVEKRRRGPFRRREDVTEENTNKFLYEALETNKREGLILSVKTRVVSLIVIGAFLVYLMPYVQVFYYEALIFGFVLIGLAQLSIGRVGRSRAELLLIILDLALMTIVLVVPNPLDPHPWSIGMQYKYGNFPYFFVLLAGAAMAYSWRTLFAVALYTSVLWMGAYYWAIHQDPALPELSARITEIIKDYPETFRLLDPNHINFEARLQEILIFCIVAGILALNSWRANRLLVRQADAMRGRANLARHFPPNIVDTLAQSDQPLGAVRAQPVAVLFADIVGFTRMAEGETPERIVEVLREFHARMEAAVFENKGTLDKFLGDGLMATFGTPETSPDDALNALRCAQAMHNHMRDWNYFRQKDGQAPIRLSVGVHYGTVVLGDIGSERRLEYAVLGDVVNVA
ncbi:MAG: adenylate/guanylate cyclase domain-containing protein, partial [Alphaproteobacteria bacterium]